MKPCSSMAATWLAQRIKVLKMKKKSEPKNSGRLSSLNPVVGNISKKDSDTEMKTKGIKIRGTGAATKGVTARGPMA